MSYRDKPWYKPVQYNDPRSEPTRAEPKETDDAVEGSAADLPHSTGGRERVKPVGGSLDTSPLHYRRARPDKNEIDLDDNDYASDEEDQPQEEHFPGE